MPRCSTNRQSICRINWHTMTVEKDGLPIGLGLDNDQLKTLVDRGEADPDSMEIDKTEELHTNSQPENLALARSVTVKRRDYNRMTREEIVRAKDVVLVAQKRRIERLERKVQDLRVCFRGEQKAPSGNQEKKPRRKEVHKAPSIQDQDREYGPLSDVR
ncbi:hypothetical protein BKA70DRAFT_1219737 [Coprinopsis sp. MPI-PUGE-AT-0042]|nr:hypothetical protein BKA70DRAFT_1219737 [Coprinopsis sp. MPI-PUGE-AT-0042]